MKPWFRALGFLGLAAAGCSELGAERASDERSPLARVRVQDLGAGSVTGQWGVASCQPERDAGFRWTGCALHGDGAVGFVASAEPRETPVDLRGHSLRMWVRANDPARLAGLELRLASGGFAKGFAAFSIPLFSDPLFNLIQPRSAPGFGDPYRETLSAKG